MDLMFNDLEALADYIRSLNGIETPEEIKRIMARVERVALDEEPMERVYESV